MLLRLYISRILLLLCDPKLLSSKQLALNMAGIIGEVFVYGRRGHDAVWRGGGVEEWSFRGKQSTTRRTAKRVFTGGVLATAAGSDENAFEPTNVRRASPKRR